MSQAMQIENVAGRQEAAELPAVGDDELQQRYMAQLDAMTDDACGRRMLSVLVEAIAWKLASIAFHCGPVAAGDVVEVFGRHLKHIAMRADAQRESEKARADGKQPH